MLLLVGTFSCERWKNCSTPTSPPNPLLLNGYSASAFLCFLVWHEVTLSAQEYWKPKKLPPLYGWDIDNDRSIKRGWWGCIRQQSAASTFNGWLIPAYGGLNPVRYPEQEPNSNNKAKKTKRIYWAWDPDTVNVTDNSSRLGPRSAAFCCSNLIAVDVEKYVWVRGKDIPVSYRFYKNQLQSLQDFVPAQIFWQVFVR